jgi:small subunit ribosomal protein S6
MNKYELALVVSAKLDNDARAAVVERAKGYISRHDGVVGEVEEWGKRKLAYEIQKQTEAYYYFIQFEGESDCPNELEKRMRIMDNVLRYLVVRKDENDTFKVTPDKADEEVEAEDEEVPAEEVAAPEAPAEEAAAEEAEEAPAEEAAE